MKAMGDLVTRESSAAFSFPIKLAPQTGLPKWRTNRPHDIHKHTKSVLSRASAPALLVFQITRSAEYTDTKGHFIYSYFGSWNNTASARSSWDKSSL